MSSKKNNYSLGEITTLITDGKHGDCKNKKNSGYYFLSVKDVKDDKLNYENARQIEKTDFDETDKRTNLQPEDILFTNTGTIGRMAIAQENEITRRTIFQKSVAIIKPNKEIVFPRYLFYLLKKENKRLCLFAAGTTQKNLLLKDLRAFHIGEIPELEDQKAISDILETIDKKIELNKKNNETLELIAKSIFKSWFTNFEPVRAKAEGRSTGLPEEISNLFPDSFDDSKLGEIPSGWKFCLSSDLYNVSIGRTPPRKEPWWFSKDKEDIPWLSIKDMGNSFIYALETSEFLTDDAVDKFNIKVVPAETVIISFKLTVGRVLITPNRMLTNEAIAHFIPLQDSIPTSYSFCLFSNFDFRSLGSTSSIATAVNSKILREMTIIDPPNKLKETFDHICNPIFQKIRQNLNESKSLEELRNTLLPKLVSGEIKIPYVKQFDEESGN